MEFQPFAVGPSPLLTNRSGPVVHRRHSFLMRAVSATEKITSGFDTVSNDLAAAMFTFWGKGMDRALEAIEVVGNAIIDEFQRLVVLVSTNFTLHSRFSFWLSLRLVVALKTLSCRPGHLIVLGVFDTFLDQFLGEGLFIRRWNFRSFFLDGFTCRFPTAIFRQFFGRAWLRRDVLLSGQFAFSLREIRIEHLLSPID